MLIHTYIHTYIYSYIHTLIHTYTHTYICSYIHTLIHTYTHTYMCSYIHIHLYIAEQYKIGVLYKSMKIDFLRRVDGDLTLVCEDNEKIIKAAKEAASSGERVNVPVTVKGYCIHYSDSNPCIHSDLILSMKIVSKSKRPPASLTMSRSDSKLGA